MAIRIMVITKKANCHESVSMNVNKVIITIVANDRTREPSCRTISLTLLTMALVKRRNTVQNTLDTMTSVGVKESCRGVRVALLQPHPSPALTLRSLYCQYVSAVMKKFQGSSVAIPSA